MKKIKNVVFKKFIKTYNDSVVKTTSGVSNKLYGNTIGKAISKVQSNIISNGTCLEKLIFVSIKNTLDNVYEIKTLSDYNKLMNEIDSTHINDDTFDISNRVYLIHKNIFTDIKHGEKKIQPDLLSIIVKDGKITFYVFEEKMGDNFDTKKSNAENEHLTIFVEQLQLKVRTGINIVYKILPFFSDESKNYLSKYGFKKAFSEDEILTRNELSELFEIDFNDLVEIYDTVQDINETMFIDYICEYRNIQRKIAKNHNFQNYIFDLTKDILGDTQNSKLLEALNSL